MCVAESEVRSEIRSKEIVRRRPRSESVSQIGVCTILGFYRFYAYGSRTPYVEISIRQSGKTAEAMMSCPAQHNEA